jgi:hypothetical protein
MARWNQETANLKIAESQCREAIEVMETWLREQPDHANQSGRFGKQRITEFHRRLAVSLWLLQTIISADKSREPELDALYRRRIEHMEQVVSAEPQNAGFRNLLCWSYLAYVPYLCYRSDLEAHDFERALTFAERAVDADPTCREAWEKVLEVQCLRGESQLAEALEKQIAARFDNQP